MGYFIRVLSKCDARMPLGELRARLAASAPTASLVVEGGDEKNWGQLLVKVGATDICEVCCDVDGGPESLVRAEAAEFVDEIQEEQPASAVRWLERYLPSV